MRIFAFLFLSIGVALASVSKVSLEQVTFEQNVGQTDPRVKYIGHAPNETLWLTAEGATLGLSMKSRQAVLKLRFEGASHEPKISAEEPRPGVSNYFIGSDPTRWHSNVPRFGKVRYRNLYPGIDLVFYGNPRKLEYDFVLGAGADPSKILLAFDGVDRMTMDATEGDLALEVGDLEIRNHKPRIYQGDKLVGGRWVVRGKRRAGFAIDSYDRTKPLVIDPVLTYATYLGGSAGDYGQAVAMDAQGNIYVTGGTDSSDFPTKAGLSTSFKSKFYAFVAKINPAASGAASLVYSSYVGGTSANGDYGQAIAVDSSGNAYISGFTYSTDFPLNNAFQTKINTAANCRGSGGQAVPCPHAFVLTLSANGGALVYSSYLGGANYDAVFGIAVDSSGNAYVTGETDSADFPTRGTPYQSRLNGTSDAFLAKIAPNGTLLYSTYFGGELDDVCNGIALDSSGMVYLACVTDSSKLPVTSNAYQSGLLGNAAAFVAKLNPSVGGPGGLTYSSYLSGTGGETEAFAVAADGSGNIYLTGSTTSPSFPVSTGAFAAFQSKYGGALDDQTFSGVPGDAFITELNPAAGGGAQLVYSTYFGGERDEQGRAIAIDSKGQITVAGATDSDLFPTTMDAFQPYFSAYLSGFIARIDPSQSGDASLLYSTVTGGTGPHDAEMITGMAADPAGNTVVIAGEDFSKDAPVTASAYQPSFRGADQSDGDAYIARFDFTQTGPLITADSKGDYVFGASYAPTKFAPGLILRLVGQGLGPDVGQQPADFPNGAFPTTLAGVQVLVNGIPAPLLYVSATKINAIAPYELANQVGNYVNVQVIYNGVAGNMPNEVVASTAPDIFAITNQNNSVNTATNPAAKGSTIIIYATGEGQLNPAGVDGQLVGATIPKPVAQVSVTIDGKPASISYAGTVPATFDGFLQVNATIPADAASGTVPVVLKIGDQSSPALNIAVQ